MMKSRKGPQLVWKFPAGDLRKKDAGEEAYFRSLLGDPEEVEERQDVPSNEEELIANIFDHDIES